MDEVDSVYTYKVEPGDLFIKTNDPYKAYISFVISNEPCITLDWDHEHIVFDKCASGVFHYYIDDWRKCD